MQCQTSKICHGCLAADRRMLQISDSQREQCYLQIISELSNNPLPNSLNVWLCWECTANITRFTQFKLQVKQAYEVLNECSIQQLSQQKCRLEIYQTTPISISPDNQNDDTTLESIKTENKINIKYEDADDQPLIDMCTDSDRCNDNDIQDTDSNNLINGKIDRPKSNGKLKRNGKLKCNGKFKPNGKLKSKVKSLFNEIELTMNEINLERSDMMLKDDYVNAMFRCELCLVSFPNEDDMKDHAYKKHELYASKHKCSICLCSFKTEVVYKYHRRKHARRFECALCSYRCTSKLQARNHSALHVHSASYDLEFKNDKACESDDNIETDTNDIKDDKFACAVCPKVFGWKTSLRKHMELHKIEAGQKRRPYCEPCRLSFTTTANLQKHVKTSSKHQMQLRIRKLKEENPQDSEKQIEDIRSSINSKRELFPCAQCDRKFQWRGNLQRHLESHAARASGSLVCQPCGRTFSSLATYTQHMKVSKKHVSENDFKYMCSECGRKFANRTKLREHVDWEHLKNFVHGCADCSKVFKSHTSLYLHRQVVHRKTGASQHLCENCGKSFPNLPKLRAHITALHTSETPYKCNICSAAYSWPSCLSRHMRRVHRTDK